MTIFRGIRSSGINSLFLFFAQKADLFFTRKIRANIARDFIAEHAPMEGILKAVLNSIPNRQIFALCCVQAKQLLWRNARNPAVNKRIVCSFKSAECPVVIKHITVKLYFLQ